MGISSFLLLTITVIGASNARMKSDSTAANQTTGNQTAVNKPAGSKTAVNQTATSQTATNKTAVGQADPSNKFSGSCGGKINLAVDGVATASSHYSKSTAERGFAGPESEWHSGDGMPQSITYQLKKRAIVCKVTFLPRLDSLKDNRERDCPTNLRIEGSHDGSFVVIKRVEGLICREGEAEIMLNNKVDYLSYRIVVESVPGRSYGAKYVVLRDIQMFGKTVRTDLRCGEKYPINGIPGECDPAGSHPCCSAWGWCGRTRKHCG